MRLFLRNICLFVAILSSVAWSQYWTAGFHHHDPSLDHHQPFLLLSSELSSIFGQTLEWGNLLRHNWDLSSQYQNYPVSRIPGRPAVSPGRLFQPKVKDER